MASESILFLYKNKNKYASPGKYHEHQEAEVSNARIYLNRLDEELAKVRKINYQAIYQNVEYCAGIYEIAFNEIFKKIEAIKAALQSNLQQKIKAIEEMRIEKIQQMVAKR